MQRLFETPISTSNLYTPDLDRLCQVLDSGCDDHGNLISGALVKQLEDRLCDYHHAEYCVTFSTGFWALVAAVRIRSLADKCDVIIPSLTYRRLADVVHWSGKTPVMVDCDDRLAISCDAVADAVTDETALILAVHPIVNCCDVSRLLGLANRRGVPIVFDAVESVHETIDSKRIGSFGVGEVFSFHASKLINGIEGGYVCTNDQRFKEQLLRFRIGESTEQTNSLGINAVMCDGHAAFAIVGLAEIEQNVAHNLTIYETYQRELSNLPGIQLVRFDAAETTSCKNIVVEVNSEYFLDRDQLVSKLNAEGVLARAHYHPALHAKSYRYPVRRMETPAADAAMNRFINLPCGQMVRPDDVVQTCQLIRAFTKQTAI